MRWLYLALAIVAETCGTICIRLSDGLSKLVPSVLLFIFFGLAIAAFVLALKVKEGERESREAEEAKKVREAQEKARLEAKLAAKEKAKQEAAEAKESKRQQAEEAKRAKDAEAKAKLEAEKAVEGEAKQGVAEAKERERRGVVEVGVKAGLAADTDLYEGDVTLTIMSPLDLGQLRKLEDCLRQAENLQPVLVGGSEDETGVVIVSVQKPTPLVSVLRAMPPVEQVVKENTKILIILRPSTAG